MEIEKLHLICPECSRVNDQVISAVGEERECTECGKISNSSDFTISSFPIKYRADESFPNAFHKTKGDNWALMIKPRHYSEFIARLVFGMIFFLVGVYFFMYVIFGLIFIFFGMYLLWSLVVRFLGRVEIELYKNKLTIFRGAGLLGRISDFKWQDITAIRPHKPESECWAMRFFYYSESQQKELYKDISLDLTAEQVNYVENFLYHKLDIRDKKIANINSALDTEELKLR